MDSQAEERSEQCFGELQISHGMYVWSLKGLPLRSELEANKSLPVTAAASKGEKTMW